MPDEKYATNVKRKRRLPSTFGRTDADGLRDDLESAAGTTMEERARILEKLCRMAAELIAHQPDPQRTLDWQDPLPRDSERLLARLRAEHRASRRA
jgi:hypothetical protein